MATISLYLDVRRTDSNNESQLKLCIAHRGRKNYIALPIKLIKEHWDREKQKVILHPNKDVFNLHIAKKKVKYELALLSLTEKGNLKHLDAKDIRDKLLEAIEDEYMPNQVKRENLFAYRFCAFIKTKTGRTKDIYQQTYNRLVEYCPELDGLSFEDITKDWLTAFDRWMEERGNAKNTRNIHLRNIRAVFNDAIDNEIISFYPFRKFKIKNLKTIKRSLSVEDLRRLFDYPIEPWQEKHLDIFKLVFFLIGINTIDLVNLKRITDGRIEYTRSKTKRLYSIKVEPEAMDIIKKYKGKEFLLSFKEAYTDYRSVYQKANKALQKIGEVEIVEASGKKSVKPIFPDLTLYWARHSWATIASSLDIPKETIAQALGHGGETVTDIYIDFDRNKIDEANRRVIDWVLYNKK